MKLIYDYSIKMKIGICGVGFVGNAIMQCLAKYEDNFSIFAYHIVAYDKYKNLNTFTALLDSDMCFICLPTLYDVEKKTYDTIELDKTLALFSELSYKGILLIKSTVLPTYCLKMNNLYPNLQIIHNPEFLSARTALEDFSKQKHIILGYTKQSEESINKVVDFYERLFPLALLSICPSEESELTKLACNSFYALKVQYFTELYLLCDKLSISFEDVKTMMLKNGWINPQHTSIPGHDGQLSFGGACLPKDISALNEFMKELQVPCKVIDAAITERNEMRDY
jgi:UDPglucose 6-dehydrogenase